MDPATITAALTTAIAMGAVSGATKSAEDAVVSIYNRLKDMVIQKSDPGNNLEVFIGEVENDPDSELAQQMLNQKIIQSGVDKDKDIKQLADKLLEKLEEKPQAQKMMQNIQQNISDHSGGSIYGNVTINN